MLTYSVFVTAEPLEENSIEELSYIISRIHDNVSVELNSANYLHFLTNISDPWLILFYESQKIDSLQAHKDWKLFVKNQKSQNLRANFGVINFSYEKILAKKLKIPEVPCYLYINNNHIYYFTGSKKLETLEKFESEKLYLQYNRRQFPIPESPNSQYSPIISLYKDHPISFILLVSLTIFTLLNIFGTFHLRKIKNSPIDQEKKTN